MNKLAEPLNLFGPNALIYTKEEASKILKDNSYYIFVAAIMLIVLFCIGKITKTELGVLESIMLVFSIYYFILGFAIRVLKSRIASILALVSFSYAVISRLLTADVGGLFFFSLIFLAASFRCVKASFYYHASPQSKTAESK